MSEVTILGAGLAGLSASYHIGHKNCLIFEKNSYSGGHIFSEKIDGIVWDQGPHVSFTKNKYVEEKFEESCDNQYNEFPVKTASFFQGVWIPHPAQSNLFAVPKELREKCIDDFIQSRGENRAIKNYEDWLIEAFGKTFYQNFPRAYTEKYWTLCPSKLTTDWVGERVFYPSVEEVLKGAISPLEDETHYIKKVRYPKYNGFGTYKNLFEDGAKLKLNHEISAISFDKKQVEFSNGYVHQFSKLISTIPLPILIQKSDAPLNVKEAAGQLNCTSVLLINVVVKHNTQLPYSWMYVYDLEKFSTRIYCSEMLSTHNVPNGYSAIQVEVYFSKIKPMLNSNEFYIEKVIQELIQMSLIKDLNYIVSKTARFIPWANVIFDFDRKPALEIIFNFLETVGYHRDEQELNPMTDWEKKKSDEGIIQLAGRYAEWKYYWTDDCILRGISFTKQD